MFVAIFAHNYSYSLRIHRGKSTFPTYLSRPWTAPPFPASTPFKQYKHRTKPHPQKLPLNHFSSILVSLTSQSTYHCSTHTRTHTHKCFSVIIHYYWIYNALLYVRLCASVFHSISNFWPLLSLKLAEGQYGGYLCTKTRTQLNVTFWRPSTSLFGVVHQFPPPLRKLYIYHFFLRWSFSFISKKRILLSALSSTFPATLSLHLRGPEPASFGNSFELHKILLHTSAEYEKLRKFYHRCADLLASSCVFLRPCWRQRIHR